MVFLKKIRVSLDDCVPAPVVHSFPKRVHLLPCKFLSSIWIFHILSFPSLMLLLQLRAFLCTVGVFCPCPVSKVESGFRFTFFSSCVKDNPNPGSRLAFCLFARMFSTIYRHKILSIYCILPYIYKYTIHIIVAVKLNIGKLSFSNWRQKAWKSMPSLVNLDAALNLPPPCLSS